MAQRSGQALTFILTSVVEISELQGISLRYVACLFWYECMKWVLDLTLLRLSDQGIGMS